MIDKIYVLNLDRKADNWHRVNKLLLSKGITAQRWSAFDGKTTEFFVNHWVNRPQSKLGLDNLGVLACGMSHIEIIKDAITNNYDRIVVFEDDIYLHKNFSLDNIPDADLVYLGATQFDWSGNEESPYYQSQRTLGTFAMVIKSTIFQTLVNTWDKTPWPIDKMLSEHIQTRPEKYSCYTMYPNLVACDVRNSDIREPWDLEQHAANVRWNLADYGLAPKTNMLDYITFCIKGSSKICEQSIKTLYPTAKIVYANKFNTITTDYVLWCKDNQEITEASNVPALFAFLEKEFSYGVIGGTIIMGNESLYVYNTITEKEGALLQKRSISKFRQTDGLVWRQCDRVGPFCLARRECLKDTTVESFWSLKKAGEWNVAYTNQASVKISN